MHRDMRRALPRGVSIQRRKNIICKTVSPCTKQMRISQPSHQFTHTNLVGDGNILHAQNYLTVMDLTWGRKGMKGKVVLCSCFSEIILM